MSKNDIYSQTPIESTYYPKNIFIPYNQNLNYLNDQPEFQFNYSQPLPDFNDIINRQKRNKNLYQASPEYESNYINERYSKVKQENADLKMKLFELERDYKIKKGEMEEQVLILRDENSNLQLQMQKIIEKQKEENNISNNIHNENIALINDLNLLHNDSLILKDDITRKVADIEEKNKIINDLRIEKTILVNDQKSMKIQIESLNNDKEVLLKQIKDKGYIGDQHENGWISCSCIRQWLRKEYNINIQVCVDNFGNIDTYYLIVMLHRCYNHLRKEGFKSYEEGEEYGIRYCFKHNLLD